jgi:virginiamycin B lyase
MKVMKLVAIAAIGCWSLSVAQAQAPTQTCKRLPRMASGGDVAIRRADDGSLWYASSGPNRIVKVDAQGLETPFVPVDGSTSGLSGLVLDGKGNVWFSKNRAGVIGRFPAAGGEGVEYAIPEQNAFPVGLTIGPDGEVWYYDPVQHKIGRVAQDGSITAFEGPQKLNPGLSATGMAAGLDNSLWFTDIGQNALFKFDLRTKAWKRYDIPTPTAHPQSVRVARDGSVWFMMTAIGKLGRFKDGAFTTVDLKNERPAGIHVAEDQSLWYVTSSGTLGRIKPDGSQERYKCNGATGPLTTTADGTVYALGNPNLLVLKPGDLTTPPKVVSQGTVQGAGMMPLGPSPVREVTLAELRKLFADKTKRLVVHYTVLPKKGCGPCDESTTVFEEFARKNAGKATFVRLANEYSEAAWSDPWYGANAKLAGLPTYITYDDQKEVARVNGRESAAVLNATLLPVPR